MKNPTLLLAALSLAALPAVAAAQAPSPLTITVTPLVSDAQTVTFIGTLQNISGDALSLDFSSFNYLGTAGTYLTDDLNQPILPASLAPNAMSAGIPLFTLDVAPDTPTGTYSGQFIISGTDTTSGSFYETDQFSDGTGDLANGAFTLTVPPAVVPEPSALLPLAFGVLGLGTLVLKARRRTVPGA